MMNKKRYYVRFKDLFALKSELTKENDSFYRRVKGYTPSDMSEKDAMKYLKIIRSCILNIQSKIKGEINNV